MKTMLMKRNRSRVARNNRPQNDGNNRNYHRDDNTDSRPRYNKVQVQQQHDKYINLAREAAGSGDRVLAERHYQHADHFHRILNEINEQRAAYEAKKLERQKEHEQNQEQSQGQNRENNQHHSDEMDCDDNAVQAVGDARSNEETADRNSDQDPPIASEKKSAPQAEEKPKKTRRKVVKKKNDNAVFEVDNSNEGAEKTPETEKSEQTELAG